eukprot:TRINITY_DN4523_c0_g2_i1.p1 TRINITY_DN4523_c0_g2~~TRINITY_DN4523_c0_g2_i1.p1  ORF type:complete len:965 (-),score=326.48 TRINITY_DN4523_c0_g2_i1:44-2938(-)
MKQMKKKLKASNDDVKDDPFDFFLQSTNIRYTYYHETHKILGNTFGMCVLQDFEALTPNLLARTIETVEGGGLIVILLNTMKSLKQLYEMSMEVHSRFRTESHQDIVARFNERFILSLASCPNCLVADDELNVLPISTHARAIVPLPPRMEEETPIEKELKELKLSMKNTEPAGPLVSLTRTVDQAKSVLAFIEAISEKTLRSTVTLTAGRGRGKSAALGIAMAAAVGFGYSNIFVTSPSPENLKTLFEFVIKGLGGLNYKEHLDYEVIQSTNPDYNKAIVRVNIFHSHRQTIQYIEPSDHNKIGQAELVVIDEAAAIPLPWVKKLLGPYLVFLASTINGYEGTGRSLSLKLIDQLRQQTGSSASSGPSAGGRVLRELALNEPIRYAPGDTVEKWLNQLLCLDASLVPSPTLTCPHPSKCDLYYVNKDTLFSFHKASEAFLQNMMALYVSSHYKNSPNDLILMSDAPAHHLFVLLGPTNKAQQTLPEILCVMQVCLEGEISKESVVKSLGRGERQSGDLIPWTISSLFQDSDFSSLSGARVVRIATHPDFQKMGYGTRALELLAAYYQGDITNLDEVKKTLVPATKSKGTDSSDSLLTEEIKPRKDLPPLLMKLSERAPERLHWLGVSFGFTPQLFHFWAKNRYVPIYLRQTANDVTGEHSTIMLRSLRLDEGMEITCSADWLVQFNKDFRRRMLNLLAYEFSTAMTTSSALAILTAKAQESSQDEAKGVPKEIQEFLMNQFDLKRLESYSKNLVDYHMITDLLHSLCLLFFNNLIPITLSHTQAAILLGMGLQHKSVDTIADELKCPSTQLLALFNKSIRKFSNYFRGIVESTVESSLIPNQQEANKEKLRSMAPLDNNLDDDLEEAGTQVTKRLQQKASEADDEGEKKKSPVDLLGSINLSQYAISGTERDWNEALKSGGSKVPAVLSVKGMKRKKEEPKAPNKSNKDQNGKKGKGKSFGKK